MNILNKFKGFRGTFVTMGVIITMSLRSIIEFCIELLKKNRHELFIAVTTALFIVPIVYSVMTQTTINGIFLFYDFLYVVGLLIAFANNTDNRYDDGYSRYDDYNKTYGYHKPYQYDNTYYKPENVEKRKNGGFTNKEVEEKKQLIRKKLEKKNLLSIKEEVIDE